MFKSALLATAAFAAPALAVTDTGSCSAVADNDRVDCHPAANADEDSCTARSCCWAESSTDGAPWCFYPSEPASLGFTVSESDPTLLQRSGPASPYGGDVQNVRLSVEQETNERLHFKLTDADNARYEVPIPLIGTSETVDAPLYEAKVAAAGEPFSISVSRADGGSTLLDSSSAPLDFSDQFLSISFQLPEGATVYGLGEHVANLALPMSSWQRVPIFTRDQGTPTGTEFNLYGAHPFYMVLEEDGSAHGVFLRNSNAMEVELRPQPGLTFRTIGGVLDFYVFAGPTPDAVVEQYTALVGLPHMPPRWALGFHLCRWGYNSQENTTLAYEGMLAAGIPLDTQWNDIDYMDIHLDFSTDPDTFPDVGAMADDLHSKGLHYVQIIDPGIANFMPAGEYAPYDDGHEADIFIKHADGTELVNVVWPGNTTFPDFLNPQGVDYWVDQFAAYQDTLAGALDGVWTDMNEPIGMVDGSTAGCPQNQWDEPPYVPAITDGYLNSATICMNSQQYYNGSTTEHYNVHSLYGMSEVMATRQALEKMNPGRRPFVLTRSSFSGEGHYGAHWLGDNTATWDDIKLAIPGILNFNMFGVPLVGVDICGFNNPTTEELCARWQEVGAFYPFSRNHNSIDMPAQAPFEMGETVANASRNALLTRYELMPTLYSLFHRSHAMGTPVARSLSFEFPADADTLAIDKQFMWGSYLLITPVLDQGATSVTGYFPPASRWFDWYSGEELAQTGSVELDAPIGQINLHLQGGSVVATAAQAVLTSDAPAPNGLHVALDGNGEAQGFTFYDDDGGDTAGTLENGEYYSWSYTATDNTLTTKMVHEHPNPSTCCSSDFSLDTLRVMGIAQEPTSVTVNGAAVAFEFDSGVLSVTKGLGSLLKDQVVAWE